MASNSQLRVHGFDFRSGTAASYDLLCSSFIWLFLVNFLRGFMRCRLEWLGPHGYFVSRCFAVNDGMLLMHCSNMAVSDVGVELSYSSVISSSFLHVSSKVR